MYCQYKVCELILGSWLIACTFFNEFFFMCTNWIQTKPSIFWNLYTMDSWKTWWKLVPKPLNQFGGPLSCLVKFEVFFQSNFGEKMRTFFGESARIIYTMIVHYIRSYHEDSQRTCVCTAALKPHPTTRRMSEFR